jgi:general secretion pathway protein I
MRKVPEVNRNSRQHCAAFTLLEVMVAVAILSIALVTLLGNQGQSIRLADESGFYTTSSRLAREKLAEIILDGETDYRADGDFGENAPGYFWRTDTLPPDFSEHEYLVAAEPYIQLLELTIYTEGEKNMYTVRRYVLTGYE